MRLSLLSVPLIWIAAPMVPLVAQTTGAGFDQALSTSLAAVARNMHATIRTDLAEAAERMGDGDCAFRPTDAIRTFGQLIGHVANANFFFCSRAAGERPPSTTNYENATDRSVVLKGLQDP